MTEHIAYKSHVINYHKYGTGQKALLAFHGFGLTGKSFKPLEKVLGSEFTIYAFDLFYHGKSHWGTPNNQLTKNDWSDFIDWFNKKNNVSRYSLMAFSMGGKFALTLIEKQSEKIDQVLLLAPDGIQTQVWYNLATYPTVFQKYFRSIIVKPERFHNILKALKSIGLVDKGISKFAANQMNSIRKRRRVYYSWIIFKPLNFDLKMLAKIINDSEMQIHMFLGAYDKIITKKGINKLLKMVKKHEIHVLNCGHNNLIDHTADFLTQK